MPQLDCGLALFAVNDLKFQRPVRTGMPYLLSTSLVSSTVLPLRSKINPTIIMLPKAEKVSNEQEFLRDPREPAWALAGLSTCSKLDFRQTVINCTLH